ncbi:hypothetical protein [Ferrovibrio sp.]|uniref:hypothetical protein n=1 Tax=Ferrovibrio sp. TaxID=1917215 RepID=UPI00260EFFA4|nr:hypothetical protein [Ferrovibrio sp.]
MLLGLVSGEADAQSLLGAREWLPPGSLSLENLSQRPAERLEEGRNFYVAFGRLAFRSPDILGGTARKAGLSCQACHANGFATHAFFIPGLSDRPGRIDVSHAFWHLRGEDQRDNPLDIPSLRGVKTKDRFGHDARTASLRDFTRRVIVMEFAGDEPDALLLDALVAYQEKLRPVDETPQPVTLQQDLADILDHLDALRVPLGEENVALAGRIATMIRGQLGFIHERFADEDMRGSRAALEDWSRQLVGIAMLAENGQWPQARQHLATLRNAIAAPPSALAADLPRSLYDPARLKVWLNTPAR